MNINQETGEVVNSGRSPRFTLWVAFLVFATVTMGSAISVKRAEGDSNSNSKWAVISSALTFAATGLVVIMHLSPMYSSYIVNTKIEGAISGILVLFWAVTVAVVSNASTGLAVDTQKDNTIVNGNLYYFSWAGFVTSVMLIVAYLRSVFGVDLVGEVKNRSSRLTLWSGLLACQLVVMGSSASVFDKDCGTNLQTDAFCARTKFGIALGIIGTLFSLGVVGMKMVTAMAPFLVEGALALFLCILNAFGVAFITSAKGPGSPIGNLYYFTWISFLCSFMLLASCYDDYSNGGVPEASTGEDTENQDVPIETIESGL